MGSPDRVGVDPDPGPTVCSGGPRSQAWSRWHSPGPGALEHGPADPGGIPWVSESPGSKGAGQTLGELTTHRAMWTQGPWNPSRPGLGSGVPADVGGESPSDSGYPRWAGWHPHTQLPRLEPSAPQGHARGSAPYSGQPCARPRRWRAPARVPCYQNIPAARLRPARGAPSPVTRRELTQVSAGAPGQVRPGL